MAFNPMRLTPGGIGRLFEDTGRFICNKKEKKSVQNEPLPSQLTNVSYLMNRIEKYKIGGLRWTVDWQQFQIGINSNRNKVKIYLCPASNVCVCLQLFLSEYWNLTCLCGGYVEIYHVPVLKKR